MSGDGRLEPKPDPLSFAASWLTLREPHDHAARNDDLARRLCRYLRPDATGAADATVRVLDLACGTGSTLRYLAPWIAGSQHWRMVDRDPALLALLPAVWQTGSRIEPICLDLAADLQELPLDGVDVVTASALLDLVSADWVDRLVAAVTASPGRPPALLLALSYDGSTRWEPVLPDDGWAVALFNRHQRADKGFGPALGPDAPVEAARRLEAAGFTVRQAPSPWRLGVADTAIQRELLAGIAGAAEAAGGPYSGSDSGSDCASARVRAWRAARDALIDEGRSSVEVGHQDLLALPKPWPRDRRPAAERCSGN